MQTSEQRWKQMMGWSLRLVLAGVFLYAGWGKLLDPTLFAIKVRNYELLSDPWVAVVALILPWLEIICGTGIVSRRLERGALIGTVMMLLVFLFALISAWARGLDIDCGCFSESLDRGALAVAVGMDLVLLVMAVILLRSSKNKDGEENRSAR